MKTMIYIFDIDGTIADCTHRLHHIAGDEPDWDAFYKACPNDRPITEVIKVLNVLDAQDDVEIWFFTGRSDLVREETIAWLAKHTEVGVCHFKMRMQGDHTPDHELKAKWFKDLAPQTRRRVAGVFEDRDRVCQMWRENGLQCFQVAEGKF